MTRCCLLISWLGICWRGLPLAFYFTFLLAYFGGEVDALCSAFCQCLHYCTRPVAGQFPATSESVVSCCILMCTPFHVLIVLLCFMLWAFWLSSESPPCVTQMLNLPCFDQGISHLVSIFNSIAYLFRFQFQAQL